MNDDDDVDDDDHDICCIVHAWTVLQKIGFVRCVILFSCYSVRNVYKVYKSSQNSKCYKQHVRD